MPTKLAIVSVVALAAAVSVPLALVALPGEIANPIIIGNSGELIDTSYPDLQYTIWDDDGALDCKYVLDPEIREVCIANGIIPLNSLDDNSADFLQYQAE